MEREERRKRRKERGERREGRRERGIFYLLNLSVIVYKIGMIISTELPRELSIMYVKYLAKYLVYNKHPLDTLIS